MIHFLMFMAKKISVLKWWLSPKKKFTDYSFFIVNFAMWKKKNSDRYQYITKMIDTFLKVFRDLVYCLYLRKASLQETSNIQCIQNHRKFSFMISICYELIYLMDLFFNVWDFSGLCAQHIRCILDICSSVL